MKTGKLTITIKFAWWFKPYIYTLATICALFNCEPSEAHINSVIDRAIRFK